MMGYSTFGDFGIFMLLFWVLVVVDLALLGMWLWKQLQKK